VTVSRKLFAILVFVALAPLGVFALTALREHESALGHELDALHRKTAEHGARSTTSALDSAERSMRGLASAIPWAELSGAERDGALVLVYEQHDDIAIASLLDEQGRAVATTTARGEHRPRIAPATLVRFEQAVPGDRTRIAFGAPFELPGEAPLVALVVPVAGPGDAPWSLAIALSLRGVCGELAAAQPPAVTTRLATPAGQLLCGRAGESADVVTTSAPVVNGWVVTVEQPRELAFASLHDVRFHSLLWMLLGVLGAVLAGSVLTQAIRRPLRELTLGAQAIARGNLEHRVTLSGGDEFAALATAFNHMSAEITAWNAELQARVDKRTAELREVEEQLLQSRKLGAVSALGAGIAHEINNPLMGVVGLTQVLLAKRDKLDDKTVKTLTTIEREALRIRDIIERLGSLAQVSVGDAQRLAIHEIVAAVASEHAAEIATKRIELVQSYPRKLPDVFGNAAQLQHAIGQLVDNSLRAMPEGGRLRLEVRTIENDAVAIDVEDSGRGIAPDVIDRIFEPFFTTKDDWHGVGLGLAIVHRIVEAHRGRIRAASKPGLGTTMTVTLPAAARAAHLA
jgi:two-component system NtrC family sensor kinase